MKSFERRLSVVGVPRLVRLHRATPHVARARRTMPPKVSIVALASALVALVLKSRLSRRKPSKPTANAIVPRVRATTAETSTTADGTPARSFARTTTSPLRTREPAIDHTAGGLETVEIRARGITARVSPFGATLVGVECARPGREDDDDGREDITLGYDDCESYDQTEGRPYFGAVCGRVANRIAKGEFALGRETFRLKKNNGENTLHGGESGWDRKRWTIEDKSRSSVTLRYESTSGEEGFPGKVIVHTVYSCVGFGERVTVEADDVSGGVKLVVKNYAELTTKMTATTDATTPISTVQHTYFNLHGHASGRDCSAHVVSMPACDRYVPVDAETLIPTGEGLKNVHGTPYDLREPTPIFAKSSDGYDNTFVIAGADATRPASELPREPPRLAARVTCPEARRALEVYTDAPGVHLYTGNFLSGTMLGKIKGGARYARQGGFCLETGWFPDAVNQHAKIGDAYPSVVVRRGDSYSHTLTYRIENDPSVDE